MKSISNVEQTEAVETTVGGGCIVSVSTHQLAMVRPHCPDRPKLAVGRGARHAAIFQSSPRTPTSLPTALPTPLFRPVLSLLNNTTSCFHCGRRGGNPSWANTVQYTK
ncbi:hypothetical protein J6590_006463 [Homalodisca vitripennis]|nr:hypothetical protein J6590_006463 [Homalodisca vitripennis]